MPPRNALADELSPYLLQHATNPVQWLPWGEAAFRRAELESKPIFLSIGYSTCHWCHVMAHESFEDEEIADFLNRHFIAVKVDREERPDVDRLYMTAAQALEGSGGWPLSVFLLPDRRPFYAGTYFPPRAQFGRPGFLDLLQAIEQAFRENLTALEQSAAGLLEHLRGQLERDADCSLPPDVLELAKAHLRREYDATCGGFGRAPKFPRPSVLFFLLDQFERTGESELGEMVLATLRSMAAGGIHDQLGGGFHRYAVDARWRVPHFEKMLYDQAQLAELFFRASRMCDDPALQQVGEGVLDYVLRDLRHGQGGFYAAEDADSPDPDNPADHGEGLFYLWRSGEVESLLERDEGALFSYHYGIRPAGNVLEDPHGEFAGRNILFVNHDPSATAAHFGRSEADARSVLQRARHKLFVARSKRLRPHLDDKVICAWNGLMLSAFVCGYRAVGREEYLRAARAVADFLLAAMYDRQRGLLYRCWRLGRGHGAGLLEDYAFFSRGLLDLAEIDGGERYLAMAVRLTEKQIELFLDRQHGGFFESSADDMSLLVRMKNDFDGAEPAANSVAAANLLRLAPHGHAEWRLLAQGVAEGFAAQLNRYPAALPLLLTSLG